MTRYAVIENTPGYLPEDDDPYVTEDLDAAKAYLVELVEQHEEWLEETNQTYSAYRDPDGMYATIDNRSGYTYDLGRVFEILVLEGE